MRPLRIAALGFALALVCSAPASAHEPGRWTLTGWSSVPNVYWQGVTTPGPGKPLFFSGFANGLHRTTRALEPAQFRGYLVVASREVWKREVARGTGGRHADRDPPNRHAHPRKGGSSLVHDRAGHPCRGLRGRWSGGGRKVASRTW